MGRQERKRWEGIDEARKLIEASRTRKLTADEVIGLKKYYTGYGGLYASNWANGQFFTPPVVTRFVLDLLDIPAGSKVLEPSCGAGAFLEQIPAGCQVTGIELMRETAEVARLCYPEADIRSADALELLSELEGRFDFVVGNPPFMKITKKYDGFPVTGKTRKAEWHFIELAVRALKPGGWLALIVPDSILGNSSEQAMRKWLMEECVYRGTISLPMETFKPVGTTCKTSVILAQKMVPGVDYGNYNVFMAICDDIGWDSRLRPTGKCDLAPVLEEYRRFMHAEGGAPLAAPQPAPAPEPMPTSAPAAEHRDNVRKLPSRRRRCDDEQLDLFAAV